MRLITASGVRNVNFYMFSRQEPYRELGANYFDQRRRHYTVDRLARRIEHLGYRVHLEPVASVA